MLQVKEGAHARHSVFGLHLSLRLLHLNWHKNSSEERENVHNKKECFLFLASVSVSASRPFELIFFALESASLV